MKMMKNITIKHTFSLQHAIKSSNPTFFVPKRSDFSRWVKIGLATLEYPAEVCFRIVGKTEIQELNRVYRKQDKPTNVLSFPSELPDTIPQDITYLGDIVLCADVIHQEAFEQNKKPEDHWTHMTLHGLLHLLGYDHIQEEEAVIMETLEIELLAKLGVNNPYEESIDV